MEVKPEQSEKVPSPILLTPLGIVTDVKPAQPLKALFPILVTLLGIIVFLSPMIKVFDDVSIIALQLSRESYFVFPLSTTIEVRSMQPKKALSPMMVTELGIITEVRPLQPKKA